MLWTITTLLFIWTFYLGQEVSHGLWDAFILSCWINWPLYLCTILAHAKHRNQPTKFWRLKNFSDFLLFGAFLPILIGVIVFNMVLAQKLAADPNVFDEMFFFVTVSSVVLWGATLISIFISYLASKIALRRPSKVGPN